MTVTLRELVIATIASLTFLMVPVADASTSLGVAIIAENAVPLRAAPRDAGQQQATMWQGEVVEVRAERLDYLQVYDYKRERGGFVRASQVRRTKLSAEEAPALLAVLRFLRDKPESEALAIGYAMAYVQAAPVEAMRGAPGIEALDGLGTVAERLAQRASSSAPRAKSADVTLSAHLDVAARYGVVFTSHERTGRMHVCYDGDAFRRVLAMRASAEQRARAALALTRKDCASPDLTIADRHRLEAMRADVLDRVDTTDLPGYLLNRVQLRRALVWASLAYQSAREGASAELAAKRALTAFTSVRKTELTDDDLSEYNDAAMRASVVRWAVLPTVDHSNLGSLSLNTEPGAAGETCISLADTSRGSAMLLARRCTYGIPWMNSAQINRERNAIVFAVQPTDSWLELWIVRKEAKGWSIRVLPPGATTPETGYVEWAGWVPGGTQMLVAREARGEGRYRRRFEVIHLDTLAVGQEAREPETAALFKRWQSAQWKTATLSVR